MVQPKFKHHSRPKTSPVEKAGSGSGNSTTNGRRSILTLLLVCGLAAAALACGLILRRQGVILPKPGASPPLQTRGTPAPASEYDSQITLDPVCQPIDAQSPRLPPGNPAPSTRRMTQRLTEYYRSTPQTSASYMNGQKAELSQGKMNNTSEISEKFRLQFESGVEQMNTGRPDSALNTGFALERSFAAVGGELDAGTLDELRMRKGVAFFRLGEQENCLATHNADSCVFPLKPKAYH